MRLCVIICDNQTDYFVNNCYRVLKNHANAHKIQSDTAEKARQTWLSNVINIFCAASCAAICSQLSRFPASCAASGAGSCARRCRAWEQDGRNRRSHSSATEPTLPGLSPGLGDRRQQFRFKIDHRDTFQHLRVVTELFAAPPGIPRYVDEAPASGLPALTG